jgi:hypothetical protein
MIVVMNAAHNESRAPNITRASTSRSSRSVPNGCMRLGTLRLAVGTERSASYVVSSGAATAMSAKAMSTTSGTAAPGFRVRRRSGSAIRRESSGDGAAACTTWLEEVMAVMCRGACYW